MNASLAVAKKNGLDVSIEVLEQRGLLAIQGPKMASVLQVLFVGKLS